MAGEGLGGDDADFRRRKRGRRHVAFARDGGGRHIDNAEYDETILLGVAQGGQSIRGVA